MEPLWWCLLFKDPTALYPPASHHDQAVHGLKADRGTNKLQFSGNAIISNPNPKYSLTTRRPDIHDIISIYIYKYSKKILPLLNVVPMCSDEVPGQRLPWNVLGYGVNSGLDVHQPPLIGVQSVLQVPARSGGVWDSPYHG